MSFFLTLSASFFISVIFRLRSHGRPIVGHNQDFDQSETVTRLCLLKSLQRLVVSVVSTAAAAYSSSRHVSAAAAATAASAAAKKLILATSLQEIDRFALLHVLRFVFEGRFLKGGVKNFI